MMAARNETAAAPARASGRKFEDVSSGLSEDQNNAVATEIAIVIVAFNIALVVTLWWEGWL